MNFADVSSSNISFPAILLAICPGSVRIRGAFPPSWADNVLPANKAKHAATIHFLIVVSFLIKPFFFVPQKYDPFPGLRFTPENFSPTGYNKF